MLVCSCPEGCALELFLSTPPGAATCSWLKCKIRKYIKSFVKVPTLGDPSNPSKLNSSGGTSGPAWSAGGGPRPPHPD